MQGIKKHKQRAAYNNTVLDNDRDFAIIDTRKGRKKMNILDYFLDAICFLVLLFLDWLTPDDEDYNINSCVIIPTVKTVFKKVEMLL